MLASGASTLANVPERLAQHVPAGITTFSTANYRNPAELPDGGVLVQNLYMSVDPAMRPRLTAGQELNEAMGGGASVTAFDLSQYELSNLAAIEWYPDGAVTPIEFAKTSERCGALLLWTRER